MHFYRFRSIIFNFHYFLCIRQGIPSLPLFSIKCSNRGLLLIICLTLNLSLKGIITEPFKLITFPFTVTVIFLQFYYPIPYFCVNSYLLFVSFPSISINVCYLRFCIIQFGTYNFIYDMNINILIVLGYW